MAVAHLDDNWQTKRRSVSERVAFLWNSNLLSDVKFVVPASNGESETKVIASHKFVLAISSPVFYAMFYGKIAETKDLIKLPDCEYESLFELFRFLYTDAVKLTGSNVMHVLYLAKKYMVPSLAEKCAEYLRDNLEVSNVFSILPHAQRFEDKDLEDQCWRLIEMHTEEAVTSDEFVTLERSQVESIVKRECLHIKEIELFRAVNLWATKECERQGKALDGKMKRRILGEEIVEAIRFPLMSQKEFISVVPDCNILTKKEIVDLIKHDNDVLSVPLKFSDIPRIKVAYAHECHRFKTLKSPSADGPWVYTPGKSDGIGFTADKDIRLCGVQHFGLEGSSYTVSVEVKDAKTGSCIVKQSGSYRSEVKHSDSHLYHGFDVVFDDPVCLKGNMRYEIVSLIEGPSSWYGENGQTAVECFGVVFSYSKAQRVTNSNGTGELRGQIPAILFYV